MPEQRKTPDGGSYTIFSEAEFQDFTAAFPAYKRKFLKKPESLGQPVEYIFRGSPFVSADAWSEYMPAAPPPTGAALGFDLIYSRLAGVVQSSEIVEFDEWKGRFASPSAAADQANNKLDQDRKLFGKIIKPQDARGAALPAHQSAFDAHLKGLRSVGLDPIFYRFDSARKQELATGAPIFMALEGGHGDMLDEFPTGRRLPYRWEDFDTFLQEPFFVLSGLYQRQQKDGIDITAAAGVEPIQPPG